MQESASQAAQEPGGGEQPSDHRPGRAALPPALVANVWRPGQSGNPAGRPAGIRTLVSRLHERLRQDEQLADAVVDALVAVAAQPAHPAWAAAQKLLWDRHDGALQEALAARTVPDIVLVAAGIHEARAVRVTSPKAPDTHQATAQVQTPTGGAPATNGAPPKASPQSARRVEV